jgi:hypothetical protein
MGVRLYNPATGLFTSVDPEEGGNANAYTYPADPINQFDLDGQRWHLKRPKWMTWKNAATAAGVAAFGVCVFASAGACVAAGVVASAFAARNKAHTFRSGTFWSEFGKGAAWSAAGGVVGRTISWGYGRRVIRYAKPTRHTKRWTRYYWTKLRRKNGVPIRGRIHHRPMHYLHQAKAGFMMNGYQYGWFKNRSHHNFGAD